MKARLPAVVAAGVGAAATLSVSLLPFARFAYRSPAVHMVLETTEAWIALLAAYLMFGRFRQRRQAGDLLLVYALALFGFTNLFLSALPGALVGAPRQGFSAWAPLATRFIGVVAFAGAAYLPDRRLPDPRRAGVQVSVAVAATLTLVAVLVAVFGPHLPATTAPRLSLEASARPRIVGHPVVLGVQLFATGAFGAAAAGFLQRAARSDDELMSWLAAAAILAAFSRLHYFLFPSLYSDWVYTGDVLRLGFYLVLLVGAAREIGAYWRGLATAAVDQERRRIARDLHDGLAQELAFILGQSRRLSVARSDAVEARQIAAAAERALDESRRAIAVLAQSPDEPLEETLAQTAEDIATRVGTRVDLDLRTTVHVGPQVREALLRILREAIANAARHGQAEVVTVRLTDGDGLRLLVRDDGRGFDPEAARPGRTGFGLTSMRERAEALGGTFAVRSQPGEGTEIEVTL